MRKDVEFAAREHQLLAGDATGRSDQVCPPKFRVDRLGSAMQVP
jgi:hypothetical protein